MSFLESNWDKIQTDMPGGVSYIDCVAEGFLLPWNHDNANMDMILKALMLLEPKIVIELGTFEGYGTEKMATALSKIGKSAKLYTFDVGHSPMNSLGVPYGMPPPEEQAVADNWREVKGWESWEKVMKKRKERVEADYPNVEVIYVEGITYDTLPVMLPKVGKYDFLFQDTLHGLNDIIREWDIFKHYARVGSVVVYDDIYREYNSLFKDWFLENVRGWVWRHAESGHEPFWTERVI